MIREANLLWQYQDTDSGLIMPYYSLPCLEWLKKQNLKEWVVFEYGAGYSTFWWRLNSVGVISIDSNRSWAKAVNVDHKESKEDFVKSIEFFCTPMGTLATGKIFERQENNLADCIIVDGDPIEWRPNCVEFCRDYVKTAGFIIIDNYDQEGFPPASEYEKFLKGWERQIFKQPNHTSWSTAVFKKP